MALIKAADILIALATRLQNDAGILAIVGSADSIKNHLPQDRPLPYVRFRTGTGNEWDCKGSTGLDGRIVIDCWSEQHGDLEILQLIDACMTSLDNVPLVLPSGEKMLLLQHLTHSTFVEPDGQTHHGVITFRQLSYGEIT